MNKFLKYFLVFEGVVLISFALGLMVFQSFQLVQEVNYSCGDKDYLSPRDFNSSLSERSIVLDNVSFDGVRPSCIGLIDKDNIYNKP